MKLITDSGSTKTDWCLIENGQTIAQIRTEGINPFVQTDGIIAPILTSIVQQFSPFVSRFSPLTEIHYYGSGIRPEMQLRMKQLLFDAFKTLMGQETIIERVGPEEHAGTSVHLSNINPQHLSSVDRLSAIHVHSDLVGAARALCGDDEGIVCILGTGSNSCLYNGKDIVNSIPPLGYILGDEGSGAVLGKRFINALFKNRLPDVLLQEYLTETHLQLPDIIDRVYRQPLPNRWLATTAPFILHHLDCEPLRELVIDNFRDFLRSNIQPYHRPDLPVNAIGGMAYHFAPQFQQALAQEQFICGTILQSPMPRLIEYHSVRN